MGIGNILALETRSKAKDTFVKTVRLTSAVNVSKGGAVYIGLKRIVGWTEILEKPRREARRRLAT